MVGILLQCARLASPSRGLENARRQRTGQFSNIESEVDDIALLDNVVLALEAHLPGILRARFAFARKVVGERDHLGTDESPLEVGMDDGGRLRRSRPDAHGPGAHLLGPRSKEGLEPEQTVSRADHPVESRFLETELGEELGTLALIELRD